MARWHVIVWTLLWLARLQSRIVLLHHHWGWELTTASFSLIVKNDFPHVITQAESLINQWWCYRQNPFLSKAERVQTSALKVGSLGPSLVIDFLSAESSLCLLSLQLPLISGSLFIPSLFGYLSASVCAHHLTQTCSRPVLINQPCRQHGEGGYVNALCQEPAVPRSRLPASPPVSLPALLPASPPVSRSACIGGHAGFNEP